MFSYIKQHCAYQSFFSSTKEKRLIFDQVPERPVAPTAPETSPRHPESRNKDITKVTDEVDGKINEAVAKVEGFPASLKQQLRDNVAQYCRTTYDVQVQRDGVVKWEQDVMAKVKEILEGLVGGAKKAKDEAADKNEKLKSLEEEMNELPTSLEEVSDEGLDLNEANLNDPATIQTELGKYQQRAEKIQKHQGTLSNYFKDATDVQQAFQKEMSSGARNAVLGGVVLGTTVGIAVATSWVPGLNLVTAGVVLAVVAGGAIVKAAERSRELARARMANEALQRFKGGFNERQQTLAGLVRDMHGDGDKLHNAAPSLRSQIEQNRAAGVGDVLQAGEQVSEQRAEAEKRQTGLKVLRATLGEKRAALGEQYDTWMEQFADATENGNELSVKKEDCQGNLNRINEAIVAIRANGSHEGQNAEHYQQLERMRHLILRGVDVMNHGGDTIDSFVNSEDAVREEFEEGQSITEFNITAVEKSTLSLDMVILDLDQQILGIDVAHGAIDDAAAQHQDTLNKVEPDIIGGVAAIALSNIQALGATQMQWKTLEPMTVEAPSYFASVGNMLAAPINLVFKEWIGHGLSALGKSIPIPGISHAVRFIGGVSEGIGDIGGALAQLPARLVGGLVAGEKEGIETAQGLASLLAVGFTEDSRKAWGGMAKAIIAYEDWGKGSDAETAGKAAANIALFLIPGVGQGMSAGRMAALAGKGFATRMVARAQGFVVGNIKAYASMPGAVVRGAGRLIKRPFIGRQAALASEVTRLGSAASTAETSLRGIQIGGQSIDDLARASGHSLDDLARMTPDEFGSTCGLNRSSTLGDIQQTVRAYNLAKQRVTLIQKTAQAEEGVRAAEVQQAAAKQAAAQPAASAQPAGASTQGPAAQPTGTPGAQPTTTPTGQPTTGPTGQPTGTPGTQPTTGPTGSPTTGPAAPQGPAGAPAEAPRPITTTQTPQQLANRVGRPQKVLHRNGTTSTGTLEQLPNGGYQVRLADGSVRPLSLRSPTAGPARVPPGRPIANADMARLKMAAESGEPITIRINGVDVPMKYVRLDGLGESARLVFQRLDSRGVVLYSPNRLRVIQRPSGVPSRAPNIARPGPTTGPVEGGVVRRPLTETDVNKLLTKRGGTVRWRHRNGQVERVQYNGLQEGRHEFVFSDQTYGTVTRYYPTGRLRMVQRARPGTQPRPLGEGGPSVMSEAPGGTAPAGAPKTTATIEAPGAAGANAPSAALTDVQQSMLAKAQSVPHRGPLNPVRPFGEAKSAYLHARSQGGGRLRSGLSGANSFLENLPLGSGYIYTVPRNMLLRGLNKIAPPFQWGLNRVSRAGRLERVQGKLVAAQEQLAAAPPGTLEHTRLTARCSALSQRVSFLESNAPGVLSRGYTHMRGAVGSLRSGWQARRAARNVPTSPTRTPKNQPGAPRARGIPENAPSHSISIQEAQNAVNRCQVVATESAKRLGRAETTFPTESSLANEISNAIDLAAIHRPGAAEYLAQLRQLRTARVDLVNRCQVVATESATRLGRVDTVFATKSSLANEISNAIDLAAIHRPGAAEYLAQLRQLRTARRAAGLPTTKPPEVA